MQQIICWNGALRLKKKMLEIRNKVRKAQKAIELSKYIDLICHTQFVYTSQTLQLKYKVLQMTKPYTRTKSGTIAIFFYCETFCLYSLA